MTEQRHRVKVVLGIISEDDTLEVLQEMLGAAKARAESEGVGDVRVVVETEKGYYDDVSVIVNLIGWREETEQEATMRQQQEAERALRTVDQRRKMYEQLKREFGGG